MSAASDLTALSRWIDEHPANLDRDPEAATLLRILKVDEELGEAVSAVIAATGQNPRKPARPEAWTEVVDELLDVAVTALGAVEHLTRNRGRTIALLEAKLEAIVERAGIPT